MLQRVRFGDDIEENVMLSSLGWGFVVEAIVATTGEALIDSDMFIPFLKGSESEEVLKEFFEFILRDIANNIDVDGKAIRLWEV